jgi:hypothetical protein
MVNMGREERAANKTRASIIRAGFPKNIFK